MSVVIERVVDGQVVEEVDTFLVETRDGDVFEVGTVEISWTHEWFKQFVGNAGISMVEYAEQVQTWYEGKYPSLDFVVTYEEEKGLYEWAPVSGFLFPEFPCVAFFCLEGKFIYGGDCEDLGGVLGVENVFEQDAWRVTL